MLNYRWKRLWVVLALGALAGFSLDVAVAQVPLHKVGRFTWLSGNWMKSAQTLVLGALPMLLGFFSFFGFFSLRGLLKAKRLRFWLLVAVAVAGASFVGPPRDRQPLLWEAPQETPQGASSERSEQRDQQLSKRVRAVAIGSAGGILLSLVVQSITPEEPQPQYYYYQQPAPRVYRRPALAAPPPPPSSAQSFSFSSLTTGLLVGLGTGMIIGSSMTEETAEEDARSAQPFSKAENGGGSNAPHALENKSAPIRGKNSQGVMK